MDILEINRIVDLMKLEDALNYDQAEIMGQLVSFEVGTTFDDRYCMKFTDVYGKSFLLDLETYDTKTL